MHIPVTPDLSVPLNTGVMRPTDVKAAAEAMFASAEFIAAFGGGAEATPADKKLARKVFTEKAPVAKITTVGAAVHIKALLDEYDQQAIKSMAQVRQFVTNRLIEEASPGKKGAIRALELLGKIAGVDLFVERAEVTVRHKSSEDLELLIREKLANLALPPASASDEPVEDAVFIPAETPIKAEPVPEVTGDPFENAEQILADFAYAHKR